MSNSSVSMQASIYVSDSHDPWFNLAFEDWSVSASSKLLSLRQPLTPDRPNQALSQNGPGPKDPVHVPQLAERHHRAESGPSSTSLRRPQIPPSRRS